MSISSEADLNKEQKEMSLSTMRFCVRDFVAFVYRRGGLGSPSFFSMQDGSGTRAHQQFFQSFRKTQPESTLYIEHTLKTRCAVPPVLFEIQGRADLIVETIGHPLHIIEIKSIAMEGASLTDKVDFLHLAQARIYAYMFCLEKDRCEPEIDVTVKYIQIQPYQIRDFTECVSFDMLEKFFFETCRHYLDWGISTRHYESSRDASIQTLAFPYPELRPGQKEFMNTVLAAIRKREPLIVQAPTGTGKTISTLYPAIKGIPKHFADYIFYVTAKSSTQDVAKKSLEDLRAQGLVLKSIQITAKEKICLFKDFYCDPALCPYAVSYYDQSSEALKELSGYFSIDAAVLQEIGEKFSVCPFEIGLDASLFCDVILCDYNYIFDPKVKLDRFFNEDSYRFTILVDEAHNLPDRANEMFSAEVSYAECLEAGRFKTFYSAALKEGISLLLRYFDCLFAFLAQEETDGAESFDSSIQVKEMFHSPHFGATRKMPKGLLKLLDSFVRNAKEELDLISDTTARSALKDLFFSAKFFLRIAEEFFSDSYITTFTKEGRTGGIHLKCMDSSSQIARLHQGKHSVVFFSATLSPVPYFENKFRCSTSNESMKKIILPSPFPRENLLVGIVPGISTKYANRPDSLAPIADLIVAAVSSKVGNYIVYSPSFEYQQGIAYAFERIMESTIHSRRMENPSEKVPVVKVMKQTQGMSEKNRRAFLAEFEQHGMRTLVAFAVMGGVFGEGIDLVGEALSGVVLVGVGLPKKSPERDIIMDYYSSILGNGYNFAYRYPGFNKILQAAGRVIRSESDRGFILLLDERYQTPEYQVLFPEDWNPVTLTSKAQLKQVLSDFTGPSTSSTSYNSAPSGPPDSGTPVRPAPEPKISPE